MTASVSPPPQLFSLVDDDGFGITVMDLGARWLSCQVPLPGGEFREVLLGHAQPQDHLTQPGYLGAVVGRYANRIANARFTAGGKTVSLLPNEGSHQLHGGPDGFDRRPWRLVSRDARHMCLALHSPADDQGFPGALHATVTYRLAPSNTVSITFTTETEERCPVNLTSHAYFNLDAAHHDVRGHRLHVAADRYLPVSDALIPLGSIEPVRETPFDFTQGRAIDDAAFDVHPQLQRAGGYDHCYVLNEACANAAAPAAELWSADGRLGLQVRTTYPGLQVYSGNRLAETLGRDGEPYPAHAGLALEPQYFPDSPNRPEWPQPDCFQAAGEPRRHVVQLTFLTGSAG